MGTLLATIYDLGVFVAGIMYGRRAGFGRGMPNWREFVANNIGFFALLLGKAFTWPIVLAVWLYHGSPPCPWRAFTELPDGREVRVVARTEI